MSTSPDTLPAGAVLAGKLRIVRLLGVGGMGSVYVAEHIQTGRQLALKIMAPRFVNNDKLRQRFEQEAKIGALIESDHVVEVHDAGVEPDTNMPWLAMELLKGEELGDVIERRGALPPAEVREIYKQLCHALAAAHAQGIVHRDLKPENLFLATARRPDVPFTLKILDFGIAKIVAEANTATTDMIGSPLWMAPEQARYDIGIKPATDVWALGLIAFRLLTGKVYWFTPHSANRSPMTLLREVGIDPLAFASTRAAALGVAALLPPGFDAWFGRCVNRSMADRFPTAREAWAALDPILERASAASPLVTVPAAPLLETLVAAEPTEPMAVPVGGTPMPPGASTTSAPTVKIERPPSPPDRRRSPTLLVAASMAALAAGVGLFLVLRSGAGDLPTRADPTLAAPPSNEEPAIAVVVAESSAPAPLATASLAGAVPRSGTPRSSSSSRTLAAASSASAVPRPSAPVSPTKPPPASPADQRGLAPNPFP